MVIIESGLLRVFRYFTGIAMIYFACLAIYLQIEVFWGTSSDFATIQTYFNLLTYVTLFGYLSIPWLRRKLGNYYLPIAICYAIAIPIFGNLIYLVSPETMDLSLMMTRSWLVFPILLIPLVVTAWQYPFIYSVFLIIVTIIVEFFVLVPFIDEINFNTIPILGAPIIQGFTYSIVTQIISQIVQEQRFQKQKLIEANIALSDHAETLEKLAITRERNRLARELHDTLAHTLSGLSVNLEAIKLMINPEQGEIRGMIDHALKNTRVGLDETRRALKDLRPKTLVDLGLRLSISEIARDAAHRGDFQLTIGDFSQFPKFSASTQQAIYRIVQETFQNIVKHSNARSISLDTRWENGLFQIIITDDGQGFDFEEIKDEEKFGINGMKERAILSGGNLDVKSLLGEGTVIELSYEVSND